MPLTYDLVASQSTLRRLGRDLVLVAMVLGGCASPGRPSADLPVKQGCDISMESQELAAELVPLRSLHGHFQGGPWTADVDDWTGRKHQAMVELGARLGQAGCRPGQIVDLLGPPDLIANPGDPVFDQVRGQPEFETPPAEDYRLLIYYWRGAHDYLYFTSTDETIVGSGWWHAYE